MTLKTETKFQAVQLLHEQAASTSKTPQLGIALRRETTSVVVFVRYPKLRVKDFLATAVSAGFCCILFNDPFRILGRSTHDLMDPFRVCLIFVAVKSLPDVVLVVELCILW